MTVNNSTDTTAPTAIITSPVSGEVIFGNVSVTVNAYDNVGVVKTELYVGGVLTATSTSAPFTMRWNTRKTSAGIKTLVVKAYDARSNVGTSASVTVTNRSAAWSGSVDGRDTVRRPDEPHCTATANRATSAQSTKEATQWREPR